MALRLDEDTVSSIGEPFLIGDLAIRRDLPADGPGVALTSIDGVPLGYLTWSPPRPGDALIRTASVPIAAGLAIFLLLSGSVMISARRNAISIWSLARPKPSRPRASMR